MLHLSQEDWVLLISYAPFTKFMTQLRQEKELVSQQIAEGDLLNLASADSTAIEYAVNVGKIRTLIEILEYTPSYKEEKDESTTDIS